MRLFDGSRELAGHVLELMREGVAVHDGDGRLVGWSPAAGAITGWTADDEGARTIARLREGLIDLGGGRWVELRRRALEHRGRRYTITLLADARDRVALREADRLLVDLGATDPLTALANRAAGHERLRQALALARREYLHVGLLSINLDRFRSVNELVGREGGDEALRLIAERLRRAVRESDSAARAGGDEFAVVLASLAGPDDAARAAERLLKELSAPYSVSGRPLALPCSIGVAVFPRDGFEAAALVRAADAALRRAKADGGNAWRVLADRPRLTVVPGLAAG